MIDVKRLKIVKSGLTKLLLVLCTSGFLSCESTGSLDPLKAKPLSQSESKQIDKLLNDLYSSFAYGPSQEPDWDLMRAQFVENAQFVGEVPEGESPKLQTLESFIRTWQNSIRGKDTPRSATSEEIISSRIRKVGKLIHIDVVFRASKSNDPKPRKAGLDSLVLINVDGRWKILSFVVHYESKL